MRSLCNTSTYDQQWELNAKPFDLESNALSTRPHAPRVRTYNGCCYTDPSLLLFCSPRFSEHHGIADKLNMCKITDVCVVYLEATQGHEMLRHDPEVEGLNPYLVKLEAV